ncbi:MAG: hypothetical protein JWO63_782 [Frankiales bacterium]|nr:hypothetical protein [Frankiales bacterium]
MRRSVRRLGVLLVLALTALGLLLGTASEASAHAVVVGSTPADGSRAAKAPTSVTIRFDEPVGLSLGYLRVVNSSGLRVDVGTETHPGNVGSSISVALKPSLGDGTFLASFRVISADSHPITGSIRFVVGNGALGLAATGSGAATVQGSVSTLLAISHWLGFMGISLVGGSWLIFSLWPSGQRRRSIRRAVWTGWGLAVLGVLGEFLLQGPYAAGGSLSTVFHGDLLDATLHVNSGQLLSVRLVLLGVLGAVLTALFDRDPRRRPGWGAEAAAIVGVGIVVTFAAGGHSATASPEWFGILIDSLHLAAAAVWLGGLSMLVVAAFAHDGPDRAEPAREPAESLEPSESREMATAAARSPIALATGYADGSDGSDGSDVLDLSDDESGHPDSDDEADARNGSGRHRRAGGGSGGAGSGGAGSGGGNSGGGFGGGDSGDPEASELAAGMPIFSRVALACVAILAVTGTIQALRDVGTVDAITTTWYGRLVTAKVVLFLVVVALGYFARRIVQRRDWARGRGPLQRMRRTLLTEVVVGVVVLGVTGVLVSQPPGKVSLAADRAKPKSAVVEVTNAASARVEVAPGTHGSVEIQVVLNGSITPTKVTATASLPAKSLGPIPVNLQAVGPRSYTASGVLLPSAGSWQITLNVQTSEFDSTTAVAVVKLS